MIDTQLHKLLVFIDSHFEAGFEPVVSSYHAWSEELFKQERKVREEIQHYGIRPFYLKGHAEYLLEIKQILEQHPFIQQFDRRAQYAMGQLLLNATDQTKRFEQAELIGHKQLIALINKIQKRGVTDRVLSQLSDSEMCLLRLSLVTGILVSLRSIVNYTYEDLLTQNNDCEIEQNVEKKPLRYGWLFSL